MTAYNSNYLIGADRDILDPRNVRMQFVIQQSGGQQATRNVKTRSGVPIQVQVIPKNRGNIYYDVPFQFPPIIKTDSKGGNWKEFNLFQAEPLPLFMGGSPRTITMQWSYIITSQMSPFKYRVGTQGAMLTSADGDKTRVRWDVETVANIVKAIRGYFYNTVASALVVRFYAYNIVGPNNNQEEWSFRLENVSVSHSDTLISDSVFDREVIVLDENGLPRIVSETVQEDVEIRATQTIPQFKIGNGGITHVRDANGNLVPANVRNVTDSKESAFENSVLRGFDGSAKLDDISTTSKSNSDGTTTFTATLDNATRSVTRDKLQVGSNFSRKVYPLRTDISVTLKFYTDMDPEAASSRAESVGAELDAEQANKAQKLISVNNPFIRNMPSLRNGTLVDWF